MEFQQPYNQLASSVTLNNCDREPVHIPGCLMPHGTLLAVRASDGVILQGARNLESLLGLRLEEQLGQPLESVFPGLLSRLQNCTIYPLLIPEGGRNGLQLVAHRSQELLILEWEPVPEDSESLLMGTQAALARLEACPDLQSLLQGLTLELRGLFHIDRVMVYRFHPDWTGEVLAESAHEKLDTHYLGLHFPATDIPAPARAIYEKVWLRVIQDARTEPVALQPLLNPDNGQPLDLTYSVLRAVSPMHVEYLNNMGVRGTVSCSLRVDGKLWGLVACHHYNPLILRQQQRASLEVLARVISQRIHQLQEAATAGEREALARSLEQIGERLEREDQGGLFATLPLLQGIVDSQGVVISHQRGWYSIGDVPYESELEEIRQLLQTRLEQRSYHTDRLPELIKLEHADRHCGVLALAPNGPEGEVALWFRPEEASTVRWAGHPQSKEVRYGPNGPRLHPRASFAEYIERASGHSRGWTNFDLWKVNQLLRVLDTSAARQSRRVQASNLALQRSNHELDSFAFMASHDLREPLRGIHHYAQFLEEDFGQTLPEEGKQMLQGVVSLTSRMESLISSLLAYSRLNHQELECCPCDLQKMAEESATILFRSRHLAGRIIVQPDLPGVYAHPPFLEQILGNLISNAIKYSEDNRVIEIGSANPRADGLVTFFVRDNGIGIPPEFHERVFQLFRRLHLPNERGGGAGAGLTIVRRMVERHGGKVELQSAPGQGTTIYVTLSGLPSAPTYAADRPPEPA